MHTRSLRAANESSDLVGTKSSTSIRNVLLCDHDLSPVHARHRGFFYRRSPSRMSGTADDHLLSPRTDRETIDIKRGTPGA